MPNGIALETNHWFGPEDIAGLTKAFEAALGKLGLVDRTDPTTVTLAKLIIELAKAGEREPERLCGLSIEALVKVGRLHDCPPCASRFALPTLSEGRRLARRRLARRRRARYAAGGGGGGFGGLGGGGLGGFGGSLGGNPFPVTAAPAGASGRPSYTLGASSGTA